MRQIVNINNTWSFLKDAKEIPTVFLNTWEVVNLPHTWNAIDGMDGGADYFRGTCQYAKMIKKAELPKSDRYFLEINGANSSADVYVNGKQKAHHDGGYSTWRVDITEDLEEETLVVIAVDNAPNDMVYPQVADFTFYGGIYRDVNIVCVNDSHFDLEYFGGKGLVITLELKEQDALVRMQTYLTNKKENQTIQYQIKDAEGNIVAETETAATETVLTIPNVHRWHGRKDPYLYTAVVTLKENTVVLDTVTSAFGCRTFRIDPENGFILNGEEYPLRGVSRHQDRIGLGNALLPETSRRRYGFDL